MKLNNLISVVPFVIHQFGLGRYKNSFSFYLPRKILNPEPRQVKMTIFHVFVFGWEEGMIIIYLPFVSNLEVKVFKF